MPARDKWTLACLRCHAPITSYRIVDLPFLPWKFDRMHAMVNCERCGHVDFLFPESDFLKGLEIKE